MLYGQELDKRYETQKASERQLLALHAHKTGALICAAVQLGALAAGASALTEHALTTYASELGLVFQIVDDILDVTSTTEELGNLSGATVNWKKPLLYRFMDWKVPAIWRSSITERPLPRWIAWGIPLIFCAAWRRNC